MKPVRIQRKRIKGWRKPPNTVDVTRSTKLGNPFRVGGYFNIGKGGNGWVWLESLRPDDRFTLVRDAKHAVEMYRTYRERYPLKPAEIEELRGKNVMCWCAVGQPCHGDVLLELANK